MRLKHFLSVFLTILTLGTSQAWAAEGDNLYSGDFTSVSNHGYTQNKTFTLSSKNFKSSVSQVASSVFYLGTNTNATNTPKGVLNNNSDFSSVVTALKAENATYNSNYETASAYALLLSDGFTSVGNIKFSWAGANGAGTAYIFADSGSGLVKLASTSVSNGTTTSGNIEYSNTSAGGMSFNSLVFVFLPNSNDKNIRLTSLVIKEGKASGGNPTCATPTFNPAAGNVVSGQTVTIASATEGGASIYYTMGADPADPTASSTPYTTPISITENTTLKAIAIKDGYDNSSVATATYTALTPLTTMGDIFTAATAAGSTETDVAITFNSWVVSAVKGNNAYVTDGPNGLVIYGSGHGFVVGNVLSGTVQCKVKLYNNYAQLSALTTSTTGLTVNTGGVISVQELDASGIAALSGANTGSVIKISGTCTKVDSKYYISGVQLWNNLFSYTNPVEDKNYHCTGVYYYGGTTYGNEIMPRSNDDIEEIPEAGAPEAPTFSPAAGTYTSIQNVTISCATDGAAIYYTTNGDEPDNTSTHYTSGTVEVGESMTLKAVAIKDDKSSTVATAAYTINLPEDENVRKTWDLSTDSYVKDPAPSPSLIQWTATYVSMKNEKTGTETAVNNYIPTTRTSTRFYTGNRLTITPSGKQLTTIVFTATSDDYADALANSTWTNATASASGSTVTVTASGPGAVVASVGGTCGFTAVQVNYTDITTKTVTITTPNPSEGTLVVKDGEDPISSGDAVAVGSTLTIVATPQSGYTLGTVSVIDEDSDPVTVTENTFVVPSKNVTVSATFNVDVTPDASLTLWENGNEVPFGGSHKQGDHVTLPTSVTHNCANRVFVGWSAVEVAKTDAKPAYNEPGADFVLSEEGENTLYAVYAAVATPASYQKLESNAFETTASYVIGAEQASGNTTMWYFSSYSNTNVNINWGEMTNDPATTAPITFTLSGTASELVAQDAVGNYLTGLTTGKFKMSTTSTTITLSNAGIIGSTDSYVLRHNYNGGNGGLRWYDGTTGTSAYFYKVVAPTYNKYSTSCDEAIDAPEFTPAEGTYTEAKSVTITAADGATIYYTMTEDGSDPANPTTSSNVYSTPISLDAPKTYKFKAYAVKGEAESDITSATYTMNLPLTTIPAVFAKATAVGSTETEVTVVFDNWVVSGIGGADNKNVFVTDGTNGFIIFGASHGFAVNDKLSGSVTANLKLYNGAAELLAVKASDITTLSHDGEVTPVVKTIDELGGVNTGAPIIVNNVKFDGTNLTDDGTNNIQPYTTLYDYTDPSSPFQTNRYYNVTGIYTQFGSKKEILPRSAADIEELAQTAPTMTWYTSSAKTATIAANATYSIDLGDEFAPVFETNSSGALTYSSNNNAVATINTTTGALTLVGGTGDVLITCAVAEDAVNNYTAGSQSFTLRVREGATVDYVVILAQYNGQWYAMKNTGVTSKTAGALVVNYSNGKIWNLAAADQETIKWKRTVDGEGNVTFQAPNDDYLKTSSDNLAQGAGESGSYQWNWNSTYYRTGTQERTFIYRVTANGFKNFAVSNAGTSDYSALPVITSAVFEDGVAYTEVRSGLEINRYYTICLPKQVTAVQGGTFWKLRYKDAEPATMAYLEEETAPFEAGAPYIFQATATELAVVYSGDAVSDPVENGALRGTFTTIATSAFASLPGNVYLLINNKICPRTTGNYLSANRAYIDYDALTINSPNAAPGKRVRAIPMQGNTATSIDELNAAEAPVKIMIDGTMYILRGEKMYDATGRLVK